MASKAHSLELTRDLLIHGADDRLGSLPLCFFVRDLQLRRWLNERHDYITRFHYFEEFSEDMLLAGLRSGAMLLSMRSAHGRSVLDLAAASATGNAAIVLRAAQPFSRESAELWPGFCPTPALELLVAPVRFSAYGRQQLIDPRKLGAARVHRRPDRTRAVAPGAGVRHLHRAPEMLLALPRTC